MDKLDAKGKELYENLLRAQCEWENYISPIVFDYVNEKLSPKVGLYYKYPYMYEYLDSLKPNNNPTISGNTTDLYKKLARLFHPDKFKNKNAEYLFKIINNAHKENNAEHLTKLESDITMILDAYDDQLLDYIKELTDPEDKPTAEDKAHNTCSLTNVAYKIFTGNIQVSDYYYTTDELLKHLEYDYMMDEELKYYYAQACIDDTIKMALDRRASRLKSDLKNK